MRNILLVLISLFLFSACSPRYITKVDVQKDTVYQVHHLRDSVYIRDSINTFVFTSGDTVYVNKFKSVIKYKEKLKVDTVKQVKNAIKTDEKVVEVKKKQGKFQIFVFGFLLGGLLLLILEKICFIKNRHS